MIIHLLINSIFSILFLISCQYSARENGNVVNQIFESGVTKVFLIHHLSGSNSLIVNYENKNVYKSELDLVPYEIRSISNDSIYIDRIVLTNIYATGKEPGVGENWRVEKLNNALTVVIRNHYLGSSGNLGTEKVDSIKYVGKYLHFHIDKKVEKIDPNMLFYDGQDFYTTRIDGDMRVFRGYQLFDNNLIKKYAFADKIESM